MMLYFVLFCFSIRAHLLTFVGKMTFPSFLLLDPQSTLRCKGKNKYRILFCQFTEVLTKSELWSLPY